ncbi:SCP2 sterol-binding domain-containing protein [Fictibacillus fluitans]|uniref:SCP2 sterol-binding domain-containing protein n=1 Tax=Fictibacillus fluitans TaxID=3058422 RepID=A0ABT8HXR7_9BACL|nr:SCP2 sterol-binding domain-containing protein [Fictibacillus sp. NE201]MDN4525564.1 SCP2 sterol-binding domain-containing protein [Fictibacillus sp. NE201]
MNWDLWADHIQRTDFLKPLVGMQKARVTPEEQTVCFTFTNTITGQERNILVSGSTEDIRLVCTGECHLGKLIKQGKLSFTGTYREQLKLESLLYLARSERCRAGEMV